MFWSFDIGTIDIEINMDLMFCTMLIFFINMLIVLLHFHKSTVFKNIIPTFAFKIVILGLWHITIPQYHP